MSKQIDQAEIERREPPASGLLLSVENLEGGKQYSARQADKTDTDTDMQDTSDELSDADGTDESDTDGTDESDADGTDNGDTDGTDTSRDADGLDA